MKKNVMIAAVLALVILTGCGSKEELTEEKYNLIAEYAAGILIDHAYVNEDRYAYKKENTSEYQEPSTKEETTEKPTKQDNTQNSTETEKNTEDATGNTISPNDNKPFDSIITYSELINIDGIKADWLRTVVTDYYSSDNMFYIKADPGKQFLVVELNLTNTAESDIKITQNDSYRLFVGDRQYRNYTSGLINEISSLKSKVIASGTSYQVAIVFSIDEGTAVSGMRLTTSSSKDTRYILIDEFVEE